MTLDILIIGFGQFGSALFKSYTKKGFRVFKIASKDDAVPKDLMDPSKAICLLCVPTQKIPEAVAQRIGILRNSYCVISTAKGLIQQENKTPCQFLDEKLGSSQKIFAMSGPSFASEIKKGKPTALVLAGQNATLLHSLSQELSTPRLRLYKNEDVLGVELCGAFKNIYAIGAGIVEGLGLGVNSRMAFTTRALAEITSLGQALGGKSMTFFGLAGVGDLFLTCSSHQSRNFKFGLGLARGKKTKSLLKSLGTVEGLWTASVAQNLCRKHQLQSPILDSIVEILKGRLAPKDAIEKLMTRETRYEF